MSKIIKVPGFRLEVRALPQSFNEKDNTIEVLFATPGARTKRWDNTIGWFLEELSLKPDHVRMERLNSGRANYLYGHNQDFPSVLGVIERAWLAPEGGHAVIRLSKRESAKEMIHEIKDGILASNSAGYRVFVYQPLEMPTDGSLPVYLAVDWEPAEISTLPVPVDIGANTRSLEPDAQLNECLVMDENTKENLMPQSNPPAIPPTTPPAAPTPEPTDQTRGLAQPSATPPAPTPAAPTGTDPVIVERQRAAEITELCEAGKLGAGFANDLIKRGLSVVDANKLIMKKWAENGTPAPSNQVIARGTTDEGDFLRRGVEEALIFRGNPTHKLEEVGKKYVNMSLLRMAEDFVGHGASGLSKGQLATRALTTTDMPLIVGNVIRRTLRESYDSAPQTFAPLAVLDTLPDYRETEIVDFGAAVGLRYVPEGSEYETGELSEKGEKYKLAKWGRKIKITQEMIVNDNLGALTRLPLLMGNACKRKESDLFWAVLTANQVMSDNIALFHASHANLVDPGTVINEDNVDIARQLMKAQKQNLENLDLVPFYLICGPAQEKSAKKVLAADLTPTKVADVNTIKGSLQGIYENRITGNQWFLACSPNAFSTIALGFLQGEAGPQLSENFNFDNDSIDYKVKHVFGVKAMDPRGFVKNPGQ